MVCGMTCLIVIPSVNFEFLRSHTDLEQRSLGEVQGVACMLPGAIIGGPHPGVCGGTLVNLSVQHYISAMNMDGP